MQRHDVIVIGAGLSGLTFAWHAAGRGREVLVLERSDRVGGCMHTARLDDGYWFELGAHTAYNSYGGLLELIEGAGLLPTLQPRAKAPFRMLRDGELQSIVKQFGWFELMTSVPRAFFIKKGGQTVADYYGSLVGRGNYARFLSAFLAAVPCQSADDFPVEMLFKKRPRRKDVMRSYTVPGGLQTVAEAAAGRDGITVRTGCGATAVRTDGAGWRVELDGGEALHAAAVCVAVPPRAAAGLVAADFGALSDALGTIRMADIHSTGVVVPADTLSIEPVAGIVPAEDVFHSAVSRDVVPDPARRAFAFHFRPGIDQTARLDRISGVLGVDRGAFEAVFEQDRVLPSPVLGHDKTAARIDTLREQAGLHLAGNYFAGMALEDCVSRAKQEVGRLCGDAPAAIG